MAYLDKEIRPSKMTPSNANYNFQSMQYDVGFHGLSRSTCGEQITANVSMGLQSYIIFPYLIAGKWKQKLCLLHVAPIRSERKEGESETFYTERITSLSPRVCFVPFT